MKLILIAVALLALSVRGQHEVEVEVEASAFMPWDDDEHDGKLTVLVKTENGVEDADDLSDEERNEIDDTLVHSEVKPTYYPRSEAEVGRVKRQRRGRWFACIRRRCVVVRGYRICEYTPGYCRYR